MDDFGFKLIAMAGDTKSFLKKVGEILVLALPKVIRFLTVIGTLAMLLVAGGIFSHNIHQIHEYFHFLPNIILDLCVGLLLGLLAVFVHKLFEKILKALKRIRKNAL